MGVKRSLLGNHRPMPRVASKRVSFWRRCLLAVLAAVPVLAVGVIGGMWKVAGIGACWVAVQLIAMEVIRAVRSDAAGSRWPALVRRTWYAFGAVLVPWLALRITLAGPRWLRLTAGALSFALLYLAVAFTLAARFSMPSRKV